MTNDETSINECADPMQTVTIELPCAMAERIMKIAKEKETNLSNILIEALDLFLRNPDNQ